MRCRDLPAMALARRDATLLPDRDTLRLTQCAWSRRWQLSHLLTCERVWLAGGCDWFLAFAEDGQAEVISEHEELHFSEELLSKSVYRKDDGDLLLCTRNQEGNETWEPLLDAKMKYRHAKVILKLGATHATHTVSARMFADAMPARVYFLLQDIYLVCRIGSCKGKVFKWVGKSFRRWDAYLRNLGLDGHISLSFSRAGADVMEHVDHGILGPRRLVVHLHSALLRLAQRASGRRRSRGHREPLGGRNLGVLCVADLHRSGGFADLARLASR